jgi:hypothetical protein
VLLLPLLLLLQLQELVFVALLAACLTVITTMLLLALPGQCYSHMLPGVTAIQLPAGAQMQLQQLLLQPMLPSPASCCYDCCVSCCRLIHRLRTLLHSSPVLLKALLLVALAC